MPGSTTANDDKGWTPLHKACDAGDEAMVIALLDAGADIHAPSTMAGKSVYGRKAHSKASRLKTSYGKGATPLHVTAFKGCSRVISILLAKGANINATDEFGWTPLFISSYFGRERAVAALIEAHADLTVCSEDTSKNTPLHVAARNEHAGIVSKLLQGGAAVDVTDGWGLTALHITAISGNKGIAECLLTHGADPNVKTPREGMFPLHFAAKNRRREVVQVLVQNGAFGDVRTNRCKEGHRGKTAQDLCAGDLEFGSWLMRILEQAHTPAIAQTKHDEDVRSVASAMTTYSWVSKASTAAPEKDCSYWMKGWCRNGGKRR